MTKEEAIGYIENYGWSTTRLGLERTRELLQRVGDPQKKLKFIHVAGSNGKGSTCVMLARILELSGYKVGMYISPYIEEFCERIQINGEYIDGDSLARITEYVMGEAEQMEDHPSQFELVTAIGMIYFLEQKVDIVVLEVGMGGALDSTNAIDAPEVAVITNIGLEHTEYLGNTLEEIASTKAGIIKTGCHAVCYDGAPVVTEVIKKVCKEKDVPLRCVDFSRLTPVSESLDGQKFLWDGKKYDLALLGEHQLHNVATVLNVIEALKERGWKVTAKAIKEGLKTVKWPARLEILGRKPLFILDGGHNPQCAEALANSLDKLLGGRKATFLLGVLADKDYPTMMDMMMPYAAEFVCLTPDSGRALPAKDLAEWFRNRGAKAEAADDFVSGIKIAEKKAGKNGIVVCFGSLYLAGHIRVEYAKLHK